MILLVLGGLAVGAGLAIPGPIGYGLCGAGGVALGAGGVALAVGVG